MLVFPPIAKNNIIFNLKKILMKPNFKEVILIQNKSHLSNLTTKSIELEAARKNFMKVINS